MRLRLARVGEGFADRVVNFDVSDGIRARRAADGRLIHQDHFVDVLGAGKLLISADVTLPISALLLQTRIDAIVN